MFDNTFTQVPVKTMKPTQREEQHANRQFENKYKKSAISVTCTVPHVMFELFFIKRLMNTTINYLPCSLALVWCQCWYYFNSVLLRLLCSHFRHVKT